MRWAVGACIALALSPRPGVTAPAGADAPPVGTNAAADVLTVSAAISLTDALEEAGRAYDSTRESVRFNFAGSNVLARQIVSGAPVDVYISADEAQMNVVAAAGAIDPTSRIDLLGNRLAVLTRRVPLDSVRALLGPGIRRIAIGDPAAVPAGVYARQYLQAAGVWDRLQPKLVPVGNVRAAVTAVENGSADAAIAYETDAIAAKSATTALVISGPDAPRIVYPAAILARARNRMAAVRFLSFLRGPAATAIFTRYKFVTLAPIR